MLAAALVSGLGLGSMYGLMALGFYVTYAVSGTVNFAQGSSMMLGAVLTYAFAQVLGWSIPASIIAALMLCALYGLVVEMVAVGGQEGRAREPCLLAEAQRVAVEGAGAWDIGDLQVHMPHRRARLAR